MDESRIKNPSVFGPSLFCTKKPGHAIPRGGPISLQWAKEIEWSEADSALIVKCKTISIPFEYITQSPRRARDLGTCVNMSWLSLRGAKVVNSALQQNTANHMQQGRSYTVVARV